MADHSDSQDPKGPIFGQSHALPKDEAESINQMIRDVQHSNRKLAIPRDDLAQSATTTMAPEVARVVAESHVLDILKRFNRDFLYGQGRFDEYARGLLLKWGDGYSRRHIWITVEGDNLIFETSHERSCGKDYCTGGHHVFPPAMWHDVAAINAELAEQFKRPIYERSDD
jgi:hypothetical protein